MINNEKIKRIGFVLIGIANFILFLREDDLVWNFILFCDEWFLYFGDCFRA